MDGFDLVFARLGEVFGLRWEWIDLERGEARRLADTKTGAKTLHLPPPTLAVLAALPRRDGNPHVMAGIKEGAALVNLEKPWRTIRAATGLGDLRVHDLWHAFASVAASSGMGLLASDPVEAAAATVAGKIAAAMAGGSAAAGKGGAGGGTGALWRLGSGSGDGRRRSRGGAGAVSVETVGFVRAALAQPQLMSKPTDVADFVSISHTLPMHEILGSSTIPPGRLQRPDRLASRHGPHR